MILNAEGVLLTAEQIEARIAELGRDLSQEYAGRELLVVGVLKGSFVFLADLVRSISIPLAVDFVQFASYGSSTASCGSVTTVRDLQEDVQGRDVLIVEDIVDTGCTLGSNGFVESLLESGASSVRICTLLDKPDRRRVDLKLDYIGFSIPDKFVVGFGLDFDGRYRNLPFISILEED